MKLPLAAALLLCCLMLAAAQKAASDMLDEVKEEFDATSEAPMLDEVKEEFDAPSEGPSSDMLDQEFDAPQEGPSDMVKEEFDAPSEAPSDEVKEEFDAPSEAPSDMVKEEFDAPSEEPSVLKEELDAPSEEPSVLKEELDAPSEEPSVELDAPSEEPSVLDQLKEELYALPEVPQDRSIVGGDEPNFGGDVTSQQWSSLTLATNFVTLGYNLLKGNPEGDFRHGGTDPGLRIAHKVMKFTYALNRRTFYQGRTHRVPDQVTFQPVTSCSSQESTKAFSGTKSYQRKLAVSVSTSVSGRYGLARFSFSLSAGFSRARAGSETSRQVITDKEVICNSGTALYRWQAALNNRYSISNDFYHAVKNLPAAYVQNTYKRFIDEWGTHFIKSVTLGGRRIKRFKSDYKQLYRYARNEYQSALSASGSYLGYRASIAVNIAGMTQRQSFTRNAASSLYTITSGLQIVESGGHFSASPSQTRAPVPIKMTLVTIDNALDSRLWTHLPERGASYNTLRISQKRRSLQTALRAYARLSRAPPASDPVIRIPNAWPDGTYSLPMPRTGCPAHGTQFGRWYTGWRHQDTEDSSNRNRFSRGHHLAGYFGRDIRTHWCSKTVSRGDYGIIWPRGSYCIGKKGNCPRGFHLGNIYWDDEDRRNRNGHSGTLPDGSYGRDTRIYYCCREDRHPHNRITLPTDRPFYLMQRHRDGCQQVTGMRVNREWVRWDDEDHRNADSETGAYPYRGGSSGRDHQLNYCYYYR